jgi:hypothetical protein
MQPGLEYYKIFAIDEVDQSVFLAYPPRPGACEHMAERFGLADPGDRVVQGIIDEPVDPLEGGPVG